VTGGGGEVYFVVYLRTLSESEALKFEFFVPSLELGMGWSGTESTITETITALLYQPRMVSVEQSVECWQEKQKYSEKICPSAALYTKNPTKPDSGSNLGVLCENPASNHPSYGTA
jgi:hypothetical protein